VAFEVIEHLDNGLQIVEQLKNYCRRLLITVPHNEPDFNIYHYIVNIIKIVMESKTQIKSYNVISVKIDPSVLNDFLDVNLSVEIKNTIISQGYEQAKSKYRKFPIDFNFKINSKSKSRPRSKSI
jgi:hypothetical protein